MIAFAGNGSADDVATTGSGAVVPAAASTAELTAAVDEVAGARAALSVTCRAAYEERFTAAAWVERGCGRLPRGDRRAAAETRARSVVSTADVLPPAEAS